MAKIFVIEDDKEIAEEVMQTLNKWNYQTETVNDWQNIQAEVSKAQPDLITVDISLPSFDGFYWTEQIRQITNAPIIFITAQSINNDGVRALAAGASDFIEKPFAMDYLIAKIQLLLKEKAIPSSTMVEAGDFRLNSLTNTVKYKDVSVRLTPTEAIILKILDILFLMRHSGF